MRAVVNLLFFPVILLALARPDSGFGADVSRKCGKASILRNGECSQLKVKFDLSDCGESRSSGTARVKCGKSDATATLETKEFRYTVSLKRDEDSWGETPWLPDGQLAQTPLPAAKANRVAAREETSPPVPNPPLVATSPPPAPEKLAAPTPAAAPLADPVTRAPLGINFSGMIDAYYSYNNNRPPTVPASANGSLAPGNTNLRTYDFQHNQFTLSFVELTLQKTEGEASVLVDLDFGPMADYNAATTALQTSGGPTVTSVDEVSKHIGQAIVSYSPTWAPLTFSFGKMATHMGGEVYKTRDNWQYSRSNLFSFAIPFWHTGAQVTATVIPSRLSLSLCIYNGWNNLTDNNSGKTLGFQIKYQPSESLTANYNYIGGAERANDNGHRRTVHELNFLNTFGPAVSLAFDLLSGAEADAGPDGQPVRWYAGTLNAKIMVTPKYWISPRAEAYYDPDGFTLGGVKQKLYSYTLTNGIRLSPSLETRIELRTDRSTLNDRFVIHDGSSKNQDTATFAVIYTL